MDFKQIESLSFVLEEESEIINNIDKNSRLYFIVDLGSRIRFSGYLLIRIIKEVFIEEEKNMSLKLFSEGELPYHLN